MSHDRSFSSIEKAITTMSQHGYNLEDLILDGKFHRFGQKNALRYVAREFQFSTSYKSILIVNYGDWRTDEKRKFQSDTPTLSIEDHKHLQKQMKHQEEELEKARRHMHDEVALECERKLESLPTAGHSPYLERKQVTGTFGCKFQGEDIYVSGRNIEGKIRTHQKIQPNGDKFFHPGGEVTGCFHTIGNLEVNQSPLIAEGLATGASLHIATGRSVIVAFNAANLIPVATALRSKYPEKQFVVCGDDDKWTLKPDRTTPTNPGREKAQKASCILKAPLIFPQFKDPSSHPTDFNDLHCLEGIEAVSSQLGTIDQCSTEEPESKKSQATLLVELCQNVELFHASEEGYSTVPVGNHLETHAIKGRGFKKCLLQRYFTAFKSAPGNQAMQDALAVLEAKAQFEGEEKKVFLRIGSLAGKIYVDLSNKEWEVIEISSEGWGLIKNPPVKFIRRARMLSLPHPMKSDQGIKELQTFLNLENEEDFKMIIAWVINAYNPEGPYIVLVLYGEQGSAKSTTVKVLRDLLDPNEAPLRREPKNSDDLMVSALGNWVVAIDNMSYLPDWLSDDFCRLATGGGLSKREHYTNDEEIVLNAKRPVILNGIDEFVAQGDLSSRTITLHLPVISENERKREKPFWERFECSRPKLLGALFDGISTALKHQDDFEFSEQLRMADAWHWISSAESSFGWDRGSTIHEFRANQDNANEIVLNSSPIAAFVRQLATHGWSGTSTELLSKLNSMRMSPSTEYNRSWPTNAKTLSDRIRRINPALRQAGIDVTCSKTPGSNSERMITISKLQNSCDANVASQE